MIKRANQATGRMHSEETKATILASLLLAAMALPLFTPSRASAQTQPGLNLQLYAGLSITGAVGTERVGRGGLWLRPNHYCRSAWRKGAKPDFTGDGGGFRVVLAPGQP